MLGSNELRALDFRIIAATHQPLEHLIEQGRFRSDLYYRLQGIEISLPALSESKRDILPLAESFLRRLGHEKSLSPRAKEKLLEHSWPGNIRELKQAILRAATLSETNQIESELFQFSTDAKSELPSVGYRTELVGHTYASNGECITTTANTLGLHRSTVHRHLTKLRAAQTVTL